MPSRSISSSPATFGLAIFGFAAVIAFLVGEALDLYLLRVLAKPWPVLVLAAIVWASGRRPYARPIAYGLLLSALGDVLLEVSPTTFLVGVGAFLLAHVAYIVAFLGETRELHWLRAIPFLAWGVAVVAWLRPGLEAAGMLVAVAVYTATICAMMWRATARLGTGARGARIAAVGALLFAASDTLIAVQRFGDDLAFAGIRYAIILLYWIGQTALAASTPTSARSRIPPTARCRSSRKRTPCTSSSAVSTRRSSTVETIASLSPARERSAVSGPDSKPASKARSIGSRSRSLRASHRSSFGVPSDGFLASTLVRQFEDGRASLPIESKPEGLQLVDHWAYGLQVSGSLGFDEHSQSAGHGDLEMSREPAGQAVVENSQGPRSLRGDRQDLAFTQAEVDDHGQDSPTRRRNDPDPVDRAQFGKGSAERASDGDLVGDRLGDQNFAVARREARGGRPGGDIGEARCRKSPHALARSSSKSSFVIRKVSTPYSPSF